MDILKALELLADKGIELTDEQVAQIQEFKAAAMREAAEKIMAEKVSGDVDQWVDEMFALAESVSLGVIGKNVGRGRGEVHEQMFRIETPYGSLKVSLTNEPTAE